MHRGPVLALLGLIVGLSLALSAAQSDAMGLGAATVSSGLGEPLRLSFPVSTRPDEEVGCVQVRPKGDDLPSVSNTRTAVIRNGFQTRVEVRSPQPVNEPAIGLVISVGCASPISREYVLFLDPPVVPAVTSADDTTRAALPETGSAARPARPPAASPLRPSRRSRASQSPASSTQRAARTRPAASPVARADLPQGSVAPVPKASAAGSPAAAPARDRLTVMPTEPMPGAAAQAPAAPSTGSVPPISATPMTAPIMAPGVTVGTPAPAAATAATPAVPSATLPAAPGATDTNDAAAREQLLRQQQADLQLQLKALGDQIAALRVQTTTLVTRNQQLEESAFSPTLAWLLIALAVIALSVAAWMAWRYAQLRRMTDGAAWWAGNTGHVAPDSDAAIDPRDGLIALDPGSRMSARPVTQTDVRATATPAPAVVSNVDRSRPSAPRNPLYPAMIDTDFTVSDIEAAMATVRTVSPARGKPRPNPVEDTEFAALGGPTVPLPFTEAPPAITPRTNKVVERDGNDVGKFVDLDIPPLPATSRPPSIAASTARAEPAPAASRNGSSGVLTNDDTEPLDFKLDIPHTFDPLATDGLKTTVVDRVEPAMVIDFELPAAPTALDFELPSATAFAPATGKHADDVDDDGSMRHGATALADLFASQAGAGIDTILELDDRDGTPLTTTEIDRLTTTAVEGQDGEIVHASTRARMARFADLMNQIDEVAISDPLRAIAQLRQHVLRDEKIPTLLWLRLFQLYKEVDKQSVYEALADHFSRRYHRPMVGWNQELADRVPQTRLSAMGQIDREIESLWGKDEGLERMRSLLCDRDQDDAVVFNAVLQRDLLDAAKVFPPNADSVVGGSGA